MFQLALLVSVLPVLALCKSKHGKVDLFVLARNNPTALCRANGGIHERSCRIPQNTPSWTLHGLWPGSQAKRQLAFCSTDKFNENDLKPIRNQLTTVWPTLIAESTHQKFWKHEFEKHGTCAPLQLNTVLDYFNASIILHEKFDVDLMLRAGGVKPSENVRYGLADLQRAAGANRVQFRCVYDKSSDWLLADVRMCLDLELKVTDCPRQGKHSLRNYQNRLKKGGPLPPAEACPLDGIKYITGEAEVEHTKIPTEGYTMAEISTVQISTTDAQTTSPTEVTVSGSTEEMSTEPSISNDPKMAAENESSPLGTQSSASIPPFSFFATTSLVLSLV